VHSSQIGCDAPAHVERSEREPLGTTIQASPRFGGTTPYGQRDAMPIFRAAMIYKTVDPAEVRPGDRIFYRDAVRRVTEVFAGGTEGGSFVIFEADEAAHLLKPVDVVDEARTHALLTRFT